MLGSDIKKQPGEGIGELAVGITFGGYLHKSGIVVFVQVDSLVGRILQPAKINLAAGDCCRQLRGRVHWSTRYSMDR